MENTSNLDLGPVPVDSVAERWGDAAAAGFVPVPNALLRAQAKLGLDANDLVVILNLLMHWWHRDRMPYPRTKAIANRAGLSVRTVQRSLHKLEEKKLVERHRARTTVATKEGLPAEFRRARARYDVSKLRERLIVVARDDVWYRPAVVRNAAVGSRAEEQVRSPNPGA